MKSKYRWMIICAALSFWACVLVALSARESSADMGPKPSIELQVNFPEEGDYCIALLVNTHSNNGGSGWWDRDTYDLNSKMIEFIGSFNQDGWCVFWSQIGDNIFRTKNKKSCKCLFSYMVPDPFRVLVVTSDFKVYVSDELDQEEFNAVCTYDVATGKLTEQFSPDQIAKKKNATVILRSGYVWLCLAATLVIELIVLALFEIPFSKRNLLCFLAINVITNLSYAYYTYNSVADMRIFTGYVIFEMVIAIVEATFYAFMLRDAEGKRCVQASLQYGVTANVASAVAGVVVLLIYRFFVRMNGDFW